MIEDLKEIAHNLPKEPGVYKFFNHEKKIIYIGKAKSLKNRVSSYFNNQAGLNRKTKRLVSEIEAIEFTVVNSEYDALLLENNLIKNHQPKYNILLKDDKTYPYICVTNDRFPKVFSTRKIENKRDQYFGPYASVKSMNIILSLIRKLYTVRTCNYDLSKENIEKNKFKVCLEYHIKNCKGPCEGLQSVENYNADIEQIIGILKGNLSPVKKHFSDKMNDAVNALAFEEAEIFKKKLEIISQFQNKSLVASPKIIALEVYTIKSNEKNAYVNYMYISNGCIVQTETVQIKKKLDESDEEILSYAILDFRQKFNSAAPKIISNIPLEDKIQGTEITIPKIGDLKKLIDLSLKNLFYFIKEKESSALNLQNQKNRNHTLIQLKADLNLKDLPRHIECFDNSNFQGTNPVAAMVCFKDGKPAKKEYRHYHIKTVIGPDDFSSMYEVVFRRYKRVIEENLSLPNLIVIDGGKGQLSSACKALEELGVYGKLSVIGIAKRLEEIYFPNDKHPLHINKKSRSLVLLQKVRNEAHRFGITFHRKIRSKKSIRSELDSIPGIGSSTKEKLLSEFKSVNNIKAASTEELEEIIGKAKTNLILGYFEKEKKKTD